MQEMEKPGQVFPVKCAVWKSQRKCWVANYVCFIGRKRVWFGIGWLVLTRFEKNALIGAIVDVAGGQDIPVVMTDTDSVQTSLTSTVILKL